MDRIIQNFMHKEWMTYDREGVRIWARGWISTGTRFLNTEEFLHYLFDILPEEGISFNEQIVKTMGQWCGNYAFTIVKNGILYMSVDIIRSIPLVYARSALNELYVSDSYEWIRKELNAVELDVQAAEMFLVSGFTYGTATFHKRIHSVLAGELLVCSGTTENRIRYFSYNCDKFEKAFFHSASDAYRELDMHLQDAIKRMMESVGTIGKWLLPLSGGYDSRVIITYLHRIGVRNVLCYSFGRPGNAESAISRRVADALGYEWFFVEFNKVDWNDIMNDPDVMDAVRYISNGVGLPVLDVILCVKILEREKKITPDDVFIPGHAFDFLCGSHVKKSMVESGILPADQIADLIMKKHAHFWRDAHGDAEMKAVLTKIITDADRKICGDSAASIMEWFNWQERQSKFIANSVRAYEVYGYRWRLPLWDVSLARWWMNITYEEKIERKLFKEAYRQVMCVPETCAIGFYGENVASSHQNAVMKLRKGYEGLKTRLTFLRNIHRILQAILVPKKMLSSLLFEEAFSGLAVTIGELLELGKPGRKMWPPRLYRHLRGSEKWSVRCTSSMHNALLAAYVLKSYLSEKFTAR